MSLLLSSLNLRRSFSGYRPILVLASLMVVVSCGGGSSEDGPAGLGVCNPPSAAVGTQVTCTVDDTSLDADCTVFFGGAPIDATFNETEGTITFTIPPGAPGPRDITFQCGSGDPKAIASDFAVSAAPPPGVTACEDNTDCPGGEVCNGGTCQAPAGGEPGPGPDPADPGAEGDVPIVVGGIIPDPVIPVAILDLDGDGVADGADACPGTTAGTAVGPNGCPAPLTASIVVTKMFDTRIGLVKIHWDVQGGEALTHLYAHSNGFYRIPDDLALPAADECKKIDDPIYTNKNLGKRRLLVKSNGDDYNDGVAELNNLAPTLDSAQKCVDGANCKGFAGGGTIPTCRIDLKNSSGNLKKSGDIYTRVLVKDAVFTLYARTQTGEEKLLTSNPIPVSDIDPSISFDNLVDEAKIHVSFTAENAIKKMTAPAGCTTMTNTYDDKDMGKITLEAKCSVTANTLTIAAFGIGEGNSYSSAFQISIDKPTVEIKPASKIRCDNEAGNPVNQDDCKGKLDIEVKAWRNFTVKQVSNNITKLSGKTTKGIPSLKLFANNDDSRTQNIEEKNEEAKFTFADVPRNHEKYKWQGGVITVGKRYSSDWLALSYEPKLEVSANATWDYSNDHDECNLAGEHCTQNDCCNPSDGCGCRHASIDGVWDCENYRLIIAFNYQVRHLKKVKLTCRGRGESSTGGEDSWTVDGLEGQYAEKVWTAEHVVKGEAANCEVVGTPHDDGPEIRKPLGWHRGKGWCDGRDQDTSDWKDSHNDEGFED